MTIIMWIKILQIVAAICTAVAIIINAVAELRESK